MESGGTVNKISYKLNAGDYSSYLTFQKIQTVSVKRQKAVARWLVCRGAPLPFRWGRWDVWKYGS